MDGWILFYASTVKNVPLVHQWKLKSIEQIVIKFTVLADNKPFITLSSLFPWGHPHAKIKYVICTQDAPLCNGQIAINFVENTQPSSKL